MTENEGQEECACLWENFISENEGLEESECLWENFMSENEGQNEKNACLQEISITIITSVGMCIYTATLILLVFMAMLEFY